MSYDYRYTQRRTNTANRPGRRSLYAPPPPPPRNGSSHHHGLFTYWVPLIVTGTIALGGLAAWIWSEREHDEDDYPSDSKPPRPQTGAGQPYPTQGSQPYSGPPPSSTQQQQQTTVSTTAGGSVGGTVVGEAAGYYDQSQSYRAGQTTETRDVQQSQQQEDSTWYGRVAGMMKRTPSPQQVYDYSAKQMGAGMAALGSIMEDNGEEIVEGRQYSDEDGRRRQTSSGRNGEKRSRRTDDKDREGFSDHERWSEEADEQSHRVGVVEAESERRAESARTVREEKGKNRAKKAVAVVVSADTDAALGPQDEQDGYSVEHFSILSHLPIASTSTTDLFILIYSPGLKALPPANYRASQPQSGSPNSTPVVHTPGSELQSISPRPSSPSFNPSNQFNALYDQALTLVASPTQILPFTTPDGYVHILRHLAPSLVYISDTLAGEDGESVSRLKGWVGHTVLVAGDEGHGGLADTETETEAEDESERRKRREKEVKWYERSEIVGLGKDVEVVDAARVGEDWGRRVGGRE